jgi:hypothetical protein
LLFDQYIEPRCGYCLRGNEIGDGDVICVKKGIVSSDDACLRFVYEPTKRIPEAARVQKTEADDKKA